MERFWESLPERVKAPYMLSLIHILINVDGHDFDALDAAFKEARETKGQPTAIIAKTIKGKNVSFMENQASWHGSAPNAEQYAVAMADLEKVGEALCQM